MHRIQAYFAGVKPVYIDGTLYVILALFGAVLITFNNDDVYKYVDARWVYWIKNGSEWIVAVTTAIKMFRSTAYADHLDDKALAASDVKSQVTQTTTQQVTQNTDTTNETK